MTRLSRIQPKLRLTGAAHDQRAMRPRACQRDVEVVATGGLRWKAGRSVDGRPVSCDHLRKIEGFRPASENLHKKTRKPPSAPVCPGPPGADTSSPCTVGVAESPPLRTGTYSVANCRRGQPLKPARAPPGPVGTAARRPAPSTRGPSAAFASTLASSVRSCWRSPSICKRAQCRHVANGTDRGPLDLRAH
jgi:hypothetical protein